MTICLVFSKADQASVCMYDAFVTSDHPLKDRVTTFVAESEPVYITRESLPNSDRYVFLSKHVGRIPCITVHSVGNPDATTLLGGSPYTLGMADPLFFYNFLKLPVSTAPLPVTPEATHHGPTEIEAPLSFVEIGSGPLQWTDLRIAEFVVNRVLSALSEESLEFEPVCAFGGPHYPERLARHAISARLGFGHIISKHAFERGIPDSVIRQAITNSRPEAGKVMIDWDGLRSPDRTRLSRVCEEAGVKTVRV